MVSVLSIDPLQFFFPSFQIDDDPCFGNYEVEPAFIWNPVLEEKEALFN